jgi:predicted TIM-barrel fold metal-dependent hydrolase
MVNNRDKYISEDPLFKLLYSDKKAKLATTDDLISNMNSQNIQKSVILNIAWSDTELCKITNDYILESIARFPDRLIGFCMVKLDSPETAIPELERCKNAGVKGVGEVRPDRGMLTDDNHTNQIVDYMIKQKLILLTHTSEPVGHLYPGKGNITPEALFPFIQNHTGLKIVCAHWGGGLPFYSMMPKVQQHFKDLYFDSAASPFLYDPKVFTQVANLVGTDKVLFGSDYPLLLPGRLLDEIDSQNLSAKDKKLISGENAMNLLGIELQE